MSLISNQSGAPTGGGNKAGLSYLQESECFMRFFEENTSISFDKVLKKYLDRFVKPYQEIGLQGDKVLPIMITSTTKHVMGKIMIDLAKFVYNDKDLRYLAKKLGECTEEDQTAYDIYTDYIEKLCLKRPVLLVISNFYEEAAHITDEDFSLLALMLDKCKNVRLWICGEAVIDDNRHSSYRQFYRILDPVPLTLFKAMQNNECLPYVYFSYNWEARSNETVNNLCEIVRDNRLPHRRDKEDCKYRSDIHEFMDHIREGKYVVVILSKAYLQSFYCMYELAGILNHDDYKDRIFPILTEESIRDDGFYYELIDYWESKKQDRVYKDLLKNKTVKRFTLKSKDTLIDDYIDKIPIIREYVKKINPNSYRFQLESNFKPLLEDLLNANRLRI